MSSDALEPPIDPDATADAAPDPNSSQPQDRPLPRPIAEGEGAPIGPYKLLQKIGEGGMGVVYMAEQEKPVRRKVALKIIKPGMDTAQVIARFDAERQALALMDHQNIARVLDVGTTDTGRPYFVMDLVKGVPITDYCDGNHLSPRQRLELFAPVCQAIQHAHQKGIIHRDIKPSNVLVTLYEGKPVSKVIDFGVAKAIDHRLTEKTMFTQFGQIVGTLEYMSPEQAEMGSLDIDTRSDIYSLGVLLYELLTGSTPLQRAKLREAAFTEILRKIREEDPPKPSTRLSESKDTLPSISAQRHTEPAKLTRLVRGELDWIVMKALEKDRTRRYETATGLARDIQRYLEGDPVDAGPPSAAYRLRKLARKHRAALSVAGAFGAVMMAATVISTWQAARATRAEAKAQANLIKAQEEEKKAKRSESEAGAVLGFFKDKVLAAARPKGQEGGLGHEVTLRAAIDAAEPSIVAGFADKPDVEAAIRNTLGISYYQLGEPALAIQQFERALALRVASLGRDHPATLATMSDLALAYLDVDRNADAITLLEDSLKRSKVTLGPGHLDTMLGMNNLALAYQYAGRTADAIEVQEEAVKFYKTTLGRDDTRTLNSMNVLAFSYRNAGRNKDAIPLLEEALKLYRAKQLGGHPDALSCMNNLANVYRIEGRTNDAIPLFTETVALCRATLGTDHPHTLIAVDNLAAAYLAAHRWSEAEITLRECLQLRLKKEPDDWTRFRTTSQLGAALIYQKRHPEAEPFLLQGYEGLKAREAKIPARSKKCLAEAGEAIVSLYRALGKNDKVDEWRKRLATSAGASRPRP